MRRSTLITHLPLSAAAGMLALMQPRLMDAARIEIMKRDMGPPPVIPDEQPRDWQGQTRRQREADQARSDAAEAKRQRRRERNLRIAQRSCHGSEA